MTGYLVVLSLLTQNIVGLSCVSCAVSIYTKEAYIFLPPLRGRSHVNSFDLFQMKSRVRLARGAVHIFSTLPDLVYDVTVQTEGHKTEQLSQSCFCHFQTSMRLHIL